MSFRTSLSKKIPYGDSGDTTTEEESKSDDMLTEEEKTEMLWIYCHEQIAACAYSLCGKEAEYRNKIAELGSWWSSKTPTQKETIEQKIRTDLPYLIKKTEK